VRTATELTVRSIADAFRRFILPRARVDDVIVSGGGARNTFLLRRLKEELPGLKFLPAGSPEASGGVDEKAKEAFAFAVLAYQTWHGEPSNLPSATGARHAVLLGTTVPKNWY
jgi:anhydro-N-acetylmuramic acid kinase